jgi:hypothetical protein
VSLENGWALKNAWPFLFLLPASNAQKKKADADCNPHRQHAFSRSAGTTDTDKR